MGSKKPATGSRQQKAGGLRVLRVLPSSTLHTPPRRVPRYTRVMAIRILCLGDIVGRPGRKVVEQKLKYLVKERKVDLVIANAENIAAGSGITQNLFHKV